MERFRTVVSPVQSSSKMAISDRILTIGSCFSDVMGDRMVQNKFQCRCNPFGTLFNPASIHKVLGYATEATYPTTDTYVRNGEIVLNYDFHSKLSALNAADIESDLTSLIDETTDFLTQTKWLIITYGTAWTYVRKDNQQVVANCHKLPQSSFDKVLMSQSSIVDSFSILYQKIIAKHPRINIVLTVSPVRHIKDTLELNSVSKSILRSACYEISKSFQQVTYFPAFEIMLDDLRDYRFYKADMIHPNDVAEDYIWEKFIATYSDPKLIQFLGQWREIQSALNHKPFHQASLAHQSFLAETLKKLQNVSSIVDVDSEIETINRRILHTSDRAKNK